MRKPSLFEQSILPLSIALAVGWACKDDKEPPSQTEDLGTYVTDTGGLTKPITLNVPEGASSVLLGCGPWGYDLLGTAWDIRDPSGALYYSNELHEDHAQTDMRVGVMDDYLPILMPVSPDHNITAGKWKARIWVAAGGEPVEVSCTQVTRTSAAGGSGVIDLNIVFVGVDGLDAGSAEGNANLQTALDKVESIWAKAGLSIGEVNYENFSGDVDRYTVIDASSSSTEAGELYETVSGTSGTELTIFLVQEITSDSGATILGQSAGPPGAATLDGTSKSGMIVGTVDLEDDAPYVGLTIAHEGAHFLGLFHTTEKSGSEHDPIGDTPEGSSGEDNFMYWAPAPDTPADVTDGQGWVLRRNPAVR